MDRSEERAALEAVAYAKDDSTRPSERLRALEMLAELRRAEEPLPHTLTAEERIETDPDRIERLIELAISQGMFDEGIEQEVERRVAERLRERFGVIPEALDEPGADEAATEPLNDQTSAIADVRRAPEAGDEVDVHPHDAMTFALIADDRPPERLSIFRR